MSHLVLIPARLLRSGQAGFLTGLLVRTGYPSQTAFTFVLIPALRDRLFLTGLLVRTHRSDPTKEAQLLVS